MKLTWLDGTTYKLLKQLYTVEEIITILDSGLGKWIILSMADEPPYDGTPYVGERGEQRSLKGFLN